MTEIAARRPTVPIEGSDFVIAANGYSDGPTQPLARYLDENGARRVWMITHPLTKEEPDEHRVELLSAGHRIPQRVRRVPNRPPFTYVFDPVIPLVPPRSHAWFGFNCVTTVAALGYRRLGRIGRVIHWNVDFVPERFGPGPLTKIYDRLDKYCCTHADGRVEISEVAMRERRRQYALGDHVPVEVIPMGNWASGTPQVDVENLDARRIVFLGSLVERMGVDLCVDSVAILKQRGTPVNLDVIGGGPLLQRLENRIQDDGLDDVVTLHGFVADFDDVLRLLSTASVGMAPYASDPNSFTRFADPGKLKAYLSVGLPILTTDVPPNAFELERSAGAEIVTDDADLLATRIDALLNDRTEWTRRHAAAQNHAGVYDWATLFGTHLPPLGIIV